MTSPEQVLLQRFGKVPLLHIGNLALEDEGRPTRLLSIYARRIRSSNTFPYNLLISAVPLALDQSLGSTRSLADLPWISLYLHSYYSLEKLARFMKLDWERVLAEPEADLPPLPVEPAQLWLNSVKEALPAHPRTKFYTFSNPVYQEKYLITVESRLRDLKLGNGLKERYEFDLLLNFDHYNLALERFEL